MSTIDDLIIFVVFGRFIWSSPNVMRLVALLTMSLKWTVLCFTWSSQRLVETYKR